ncbi:MAG: hypothetical protein ACRD0N_15200 [Acidimicrobiales bacterium]
MVWVPYDEEDSARYLAELARDTGGAATGAFLMIVSALLLVPVALALGTVVGERMPRLGRIAGGMAVAGTIGMASLSAVALVACSMADAADRTAMVGAWDSFFNGAASETIFLFILVGAIGFVALGVGLFRSGVVARPAAVLAAVGGAATLFTTGGPARGLLVVAAALALVGFAWVAAGTRTQGGTETRRHGIIRA